METTTCTPPWIRNVRVSALHPEDTPHPVSISPLSLPVSVFHPDTSDLLWPGLAMAPGLWVWGGVMERMDGVCPRFKNTREVSSVDLSQTDLDLNPGLDSYQLCSNWKVTYLLWFFFSLDKMGIAWFVGSLWKLNKNSGEVHLLSIKSYRNASDCLLRDSQRARMEKGLGFSWTKP